MDKNCRTPRGRSEGSSWCGWLRLITEVEKLLKLSKPKLEKLKWVAPILIVSYILVILLISGLSQAHMSEVRASHPAVPVDSGE